VSEPLFLSKEEVLALHHRQIELFGGDMGLGDSGLLESALAQPQNTYLYRSDADLLDIAAAYAFHLAKNHPFNDGNKRTALQAALTFLKLNGVTIIIGPDALYGAMICLTTGESNKDEFAVFLRKHSQRSA